MKFMRMGCRVTFWARTMVRNNADIDKKPSSRNIKTKVSECNIVK